MSTQPRKLLAGTPTQRIVFGLFAVTLVWLAICNWRSSVLPNAITIPGILAGLALSWFVPTLHGRSAPLPSLYVAVKGVLVGTIVVYGLSIAGKAVFGRQDVVLPASSKVALSQTALVLPDREIPYEEIFFRSSDQVEMRAQTVLVRTIEAGGESSNVFENVVVALTPTKLSVGDTSFEPSRVAHLEATTDRIVLPREMIGLGLVKLAGLIGVFLGWRGTLFAIGCGGAVSALVYLLALAMHQWHGQSIDVATPMCIASIVWVIFRSKVLKAGET